MMQGLSFFRAANLSRPSKAALTRAVIASGKEFRETFGRFHTSHRDKWTIGLAALVDETFRERASASASMMSFYRAQPAS
jgi:hypothetical protein